MMKNKINQNIKKKLPIVLLILLISNLIKLNNNSSNWNKINIKRFLATILPLMILLNNMQHFSIFQVMNKELMCQNKWKSLLL